MHWKCCGRLGPVQPLLFLYFWCSSYQTKGAELCPEEDGWHSNGKSCYYVSGEKQEWKEAREDCHDKQAELTSINDANEAAYLRNRPTTKANKNYWIGLYKDVMRRETYWLDKSSSTYRLWAKGEPDSWDWCFSMKYENGDEWKFFGDLCGNNFYYICKRIIGTTTTALPTETSLAKMTTEMQVITVTSSRSISDSEITSEGFSEQLSSSAQIGQPNTTTLESVRKTDSEPTERNIGFVVGLSLGLGLLLMLAGVAAAVLIVYSRWRRPKERNCRDNDYETVSWQTSTRHQYETLSTVATSGDLNNQQLNVVTTTPPVAIVAPYDNSPITLSSFDYQPPYNYAETNLVDNALYGSELAKSTHVTVGYEYAEPFADDKLTTTGPEKSTLVDNPLYGKQTAVSKVLTLPDGYENVNAVHHPNSPAASHADHPSVYVDRDVILVDNTLYGCETSEPTSKNPEINADYQDLTVVDNALYDS